VTATAAVVTIMYSIQLEDSVVATVVMDDAILSIGALPNLKSTATAIPPVEMLMLML
jgi:hypothetical protein